MAKLIKKDSTVSELYEEKTGKKWSTAKAEGLTSGSYEDNMKLKRRLLSGEFDLEKNNLIETAKKITNIKSSYDSGPVEENMNKHLIPTKNKEYDDVKSFKDAFIKARKELGAGKVFTYNGKLYTTNYAEENSNNIVSNQNEINATQVTSNPLELIVLEPSGAGSKVGWKIIEKQAIKQSSKLLYF